MSCSLDLLSDQARGGQAFGLRIRAESSWMSEVNLQVSENFHREKRGSGSRGAFRL